MTERRTTGLPRWSRHLRYGANPTACPRGDGEVRIGQWATVETATRRVWHSLCAEAAEDGPILSDPLAPASAPFDGSRDIGEAGVAGGADGAAGLPVVRRGWPPAAPSPARR